MTREQVSRTLSYMERLRMDSYEAESESQRLRMVGEYNRLWKSIQPYVEERAALAGKEGP